jgi:glycosyltransferase involved in cell wall biosynthesis
MRILLINKFLYPKGGDAISTISTGELLRSNGHEVVFWGMDHPLNQSDYPYKQYFVPYVDLNNVFGIRNRFKTMINMFYSVEAKKRLDKLILIYRPDIVHLNNFAHQISPSILHVTYKYNIPVVMTMHDYKIVCPTYSMLLKGKTCEKCKEGRYYQCFINRCTKTSYTKSLLNTVEMYLHQNILRLYDLIDIFISPSMFMKSKCAEMGLLDRIVSLPHFINISEYCPKYERTEQSIVYFGRLSHEKGLLTLIRAMKNIPNITLKIIGEGPVKNYLQSEVFSMNLNNVNFLGYKSGQELKKEISNSIFVVFPSECYEVFGLAVIESFALGKPVIGSRIGGIPELVKDNETGLTFEPSNLEDLSAKIKELLNSPEKVVEMGKNARVYVERELNSEKHYSGLMEIYQQTQAMH